MPQVRTQSIYRTSTLLTMGVILLVAFALRVRQLEVYPAGLSFDEGTNAVDATLTATTGALPFFEEGFGRPEPTYRAVLAVGVWLWGPSIWSMRAFTALLNTVLVAIVFRLTWEWLADLPHAARIGGALVAAGTLTMLVGHLTLSRALYRAAPMWFCIALTALFLIRGLRTNRWRDFTLGGFFAGGVVYTYTAGWFVPPTLLALGASRLLFDRRSAAMWLPRLLFAGIVAVVVAAPVLYLALTMPEIIFTRTTDVVAQTTNLVQASRAAIDQLIVAGDENPQYNTASAPVVAWLAVPFFLPGILTSLLRIHQPGSLLLLTMLLVFNLPALLSDEITHGLRISGQFVVVSTLAGAGFAGLLWMLDRIWRSSTGVIRVGQLGALVFVLVGGWQSWETYAGYWRDGGASQQWNVHGLTLDSGEWLFRSDRRAFADWVAAQETPLLLPLAEINRATTRAWLLDDFPQVQPLSPAPTIPEDTRLVIPWVLETGDLLRDAQHLALLHNRTISLLPPLDETSAQSLLAHIDNADHIEGPGPVLTFLGRVQPVEPIALRFAEPWTVSDDPPLVTFDANTLDLVGVDAPRTLKQGETNPITLFWEAQRDPWHDYFSHVQIQTQDYQRVVGQQQQITRWVYPTTVWQPSQRLPDAYGLNLPETLPYGAYRLMVGLSWSVHPPTSDFASTVGLGLDQLAMAAWLKVPQPEPIIIPEDAQPADVRIAGSITLDAVRVVPAETGSIVQCYWQAVADRPSFDATIFVHLLDGQDEIIAQNDQRPHDGRYPTLIWDAGEIVRTDHPIPIASEALKGYRIAVGMYTFPGPLNLPLTQNGTPIVRGRAVLGAVDAFLAQ